MQVNVHQAKSQLSQLLVAVENGEEVVIARNGVPVAKMVPAKKRGGMILGLLEKEGKGVNTPDDLTLAAIDRDIEQMFYDSGELKAPKALQSVQEPLASYGAKRGTKATSKVRSTTTKRKPTATPPRSRK
jgi:prevent-host-death family protein